MSYFSNVALAIKKTDCERMLVGIKERNFKHPEQVEKFIKDGMNNAPVCREPEYVYLYWEFVKWYREIEAVDYIEDCRMWFTEYDYVYLGESWDDNEMELGAELLGISRFIDYLEDENPV